MLNELELAWAAETTNCNHASGTSPGETTWLVISPHTVMVQVPLEDAEFSTSDPAIVTSLACNMDGRCENTAGGNVVYSLVMQGGLPAWIRVCVYAPKLWFGGPGCGADENTGCEGLILTDTSQLNVWGWTINWIGTEDIRRGGQGELIEATKWQSQSFSKRVDTSGAEFPATSTPPQYFFSPAVMQPRSSVTDCARLGVTKCEVPDHGYPTSVTSDDAKALFSDDNCGAFPRHVHYLNTCVDNAVPLCNTMASNEDGVIVVS